MALNNELADLFQTMAAILEIEGEPVFKAIAFQRVSRFLNETTLDLREAVEQGTLKSIQGIGSSSQKIIEEYVRTGRSTDYEELSARVPAGLLPLLQIPGLGPKTIGLLWRQRQITNIEDLVKAIDTGALAGIKGIGEKKIQSIKEGIALQAQAAERAGIVDAMAVARAMVERLLALPQVERAEIAGSLRRRRETIGDIDLLCTLHDPSQGAAVSEKFQHFPEVTKILAAGATKASVVTAGRMQVDLRIVPPASFGAALQYFTGSKDHNKKLRGLALDREMTLNEWGLYRLDEYDRAEKKPGVPPTTKAVAGASEEEVYRALGLPWIEPELREDRGELEAAANKSLPALITLADIRGDLHTHTTASDGDATILEMAQAAKDRGYAFLGISDHSKSQVIANGLSPERLLQHIKAIHKANDQIKGITLFAGCEVDILVDGALDYEDAVLAELDYVVASPHISLKQDQAKATDRLLRAIDHRYVTFIGHPTGRLIQRRAGLPLAFGRVFEAAAKNGTAMEINAGYPRLDLSDINARAALEAGVTLTINTDAHSVGGLGMMPFGIDVARRAWATPQQVINCLTLAQLKTFLKKKR